MNSSTKKRLSSPIEKTFGEMRITYSIQNRCGEYALKVSSAELLGGCMIIADIARDRTTAESIKMILAENLVSPMHIFDVLENILA